MSWSQKWLFKLSSYKSLTMVFLLGSIIIGTCDYFLWFDLTADTKISSIILWGTALIIIKYTIETYDLRRATEKELHIQEEIMMNEFLPVVVPYNGMIQNRKLHIDLRNAGRGIAKNVEIKLNSIAVARGVSVLGNNGVTREFHEDTIGAQSAVASRNSISMELTYQDIYNRKFRTSKCEFYRDEPSPQNRFQLKEGGWRFERVSR